MDDEAVDRHARRRGAIGLFQDALGVGGLDVAHELVDRIEIAVADRRHHDVADAPPVDAGDLRRWHVSHALRLSFGHEPRGHFQDIGIAAERRERRFGFRDQRLQPRFGAGDAEDT